MRIRIDIAYDEYMKYLHELKNISTINNERVQAKRYAALNDRIVSKWFNDLFTKLVKSE